MRIAITAPYFQEEKYGGAELWCREVGLELARRGHEVVVLTTNLTRHGSVFEPKAPLRGTPWGLPTRRHRVSLLAGAFTRPFGFFPLAPGLPFDRAMRRADVVLVSGIEDPTSALAVLGARLAGKPVVVMGHTHMDLWRAAGPDRRMLLALIEGSHACYFQPNTAAELPFWRARVEERRILAPVGCGVRPLARGADEERAAARERLGIPQDEPVVLFLGRVHWAKGVLRALAAMEGLHPEEARMYLVGFLEDAPAKLRGEVVRLRPFLEEAFPGSRHRVVGDVDDDLKHRWLAACDLLVLPSHHESFGIVFLEAWQHGRPVIGWNGGGMPAVIRDGEDGFVVGRVGELRDRIATLLAKPELARRMGEAGRVKVAAEFGWPQVAERVEANLRRVVEALEPERLAAKGTSEELREFLALRRAGDAEAPQRARRREAPKR